jgi:nitrite reductase/ring-hydroxylating ferredoxin subunit
MHFRTFSLSSKGDWTAEDADWNYKDVPHLNQVHSLAWAYGTAIDDDFIATINLQKIAGIQVPIALANYDASDGSQVYYTTLLCFVLIVETRLSDEPAGDNGHHQGVAVTTYHVGGPRFAMWLFPLLKRTLAANYKVLMSEDLPMRDQRGRLRKVGYRFASDGRPRTFAETTDLTVSNVIPPTIERRDSTKIDIGMLHAEGSTLIAGAGPAGLRFVRGPGTEVMIFDRVCGHEGAALDDATLQSGCLICPWHAKRVKPVARVQLGATELQWIRLDSGCEISIEEDICSIVGLR